MSVKAIIDKLPNIYPLPIGAPMCAFSFLTISEESMINWFNMPDGGLSNGGEFEIKELTATENKVYETPGEVYNKVTVNVEGGGGSSDFSTATMTVTGGTPVIYMATIIDMAEYGVVGSYPTNTELSSPYTIILYKGKAYVSIDATIASISGDASVDQITGMLVVTGDCTITIS